MSPDREGTALGGTAAGVKVVATLVAGLIAVTAVVGGCAVQVPGTPGPDPSVLAAPPTSTSAPRPAGFFTDAAGRFGLVPPAGWSVDTSGTRGTAVVFLDPEPAETAAGDFSPNINVLVTSSNAGLPATIVGARTELTALAGYRPTVDEPAVLADGTPAHRLGGDFDDPASGFALRNVQVIAVQGDSAFVVTGTCPVEVWSDCQPVFDRALRTLRVTR